MARNSILLISGKLSNSVVTTILGLNLRHIQGFLPSLGLPAFDAKFQGEREQGLCNVAAWRGMCGEE